MAKVACSSAVSDRTNQASLQWGRKPFHLFSGKNCSQSSAKRVQRRLAAGRRAGSLALLILGFGFAVWASAAETEFEFNVPRQPVRSALMEFAEQADLTLVFPDDVVRDKSANALTGRHTLQQGADILLAGTGLTPMFSDATVLSISAHRQLMNTGSAMRRDKGNDTVANRNRLFAALAGFASGLFGAEALAQSQDGVPTGPLLEEIVVTASKREESLQAVSVSVTAFSSDDINALGFDNGLDISDQVPNFTVQSLFGHSGPPFMNIRGISTVAFTVVNETAVGTYVDDVYQGSISAVTGQLFDIERVEVLRGPQGTLFGRNTTAGLVHYVSRKPTEEFDGYASVQLGEHNQVIVEAAVSNTLSEGIRGRIAYKQNRDDGFQKNTNPAFNNARAGITDVRTARATLQFDLRDEWMAEVSAHWAESDSTMQAYRFAGLFDESTTVGVPCSVNDFLNDRCYNGAGGSNFNPDPKETFSVFDGVDNTYDAHGGYLRFTGGLGFADFVSTTAYETFDSLSVQDYNIIEVASVRRTGPFAIEHEQVTQEFRLDGSTDVFDWLAGFFYYSDKKAIGVDFVFSPDSPASLGYRTATETDSYALFGEIDFALTDSLRLIAGGRVTQEDRKLTRYDGGGGGEYEQIDAFDLIDDVDETEFTWRAAAEYQSVDDHLYYAQISKGFKSGSYNSSVAPGLQGVLNTGPADSETVINYELGVKSEWLNRLRLNAAIFYQDFEDIQQTISTDELSQVFSNAGEVTIYGIELELSYLPTAWMEIGFGAATLESDINSNSDLLDGGELGAPDYNLNAVVRLFQDLGNIGRLTYQLDGRYQDDTFLFPDNNPYEFQEAYGVWNARLSWNSADDKYSITGFVENAGDEEYVTYALQSTPTNLGSFGFRTNGLPRLWGVNFAMTLQ